MFGNVNNIFGVYKMIFTVNIYKISKHIIGSWKMAVLMLLTKCIVIVELKANLSE